MDMCDDLAENCVTLLVLSTDDLSLALIVGDANVVPQNVNSSQGRL